MQLQQHVERLAEALVMCDAEDAAGIAALKGDFEKLKQAAACFAKPEIADIARRAAQLIDSETSGAAKFEMLGQVVNVLQSVVCQGRPLDKSSLPKNFIPAAAGSVEEKESRDSAGKCQPLPPQLDAAIFSDFLSHQDKVLEDVETLGMDLEKDADPAKVAALLRILHNLKGEAGVLGLVEVEKLTHHTESIIGQGAPPEWVEYLLLFKDWLSRVFSFYAGKGPAPEAAELLLQQRPAVQESKASTPAKPAGKSATQPAVAQPPVLVASAPLKAFPLPTDETELLLLNEFVSESKEHLEVADIQLLTLETEPENAEALNAVFRGFHTIKGVASCLNLPNIPGLAHAAENLLDRARKGELRLAGGAIDVTFDAVDLLKRSVEAVSTALSKSQPIEQDPEVPLLQARLKAVAAGQVPAAKEPPPKMLGEILVERNAVKQEVVDQVLQKQQEAHSESKLGEQLVREKQVEAQEVVQALRAQKGPAAEGGSVQVKDTIKVDADRLDRLVDMIGELVIAESMVSQSDELRQGASASLLRHLGQLDKITRGLQEIGTSLRMVPVRSVFQKMARLVRDLSKKVNKQVEFVMSGEETELDKTVVEKISDPLVHMIRNAVDHGLESNPDDRVKAGKAPAGRVDLRAYHKGGNIHIEIQDDGRGLDRDAILAKAKERGLVREGETLSDRAIFNLIFLPGFSTAKVVTDVSGRGVGMDVVRRNIESLRGQVEIQSEKGKGSMFCIRLPLTMAIIDGMVLGVGGERYIIPTLSIRMSLRPLPKDISTVLGQGEMLRLQGRLLPLFRLSSLFNIPNAVQNITEALVVVVEDEGRQAGLVADVLLGHQQIVIKTLGEGMRGLPGISGGAIMPDGEVGLIMDVGGLVHLAQAGRNGNPARATSVAVE
jgi:two-component system chemotaxis sensor kinase CheA